MFTVRESLNQFIENLDGCEEFVRYRTAAKKVREYPDKAKRLQEFRKKNYLIQNSKDSIDLFAECERLEEEYADVYKDPILHEFLNAEVAICKIIQGVNREMIACIGFEDVLVDDEV